MSCSVELSIKKFVASMPGFKLACLYRRVKRYSNSINFEHCIFIEKNALLAGIAGCGLNLYNNKPSFTKTV